MNRRSGRFESIPLETGFEQHHDSHESHSHFRVAGSDSDSESKISFRKLELLVHRGGTVTDFFKFESSYNRRRDRSALASGDLNSKCGHWRLPAGTLDVTVTCASGAGGGPATVTCNASAAATQA